MITRAARSKAPRIEPTSHAWRGVLVTVRYPDRPDERPMERFAVFALDLPRGRVIWVEGSYADPYGWPSPSSHEVRRLREVESGFEGENEAGWIATLEPYRRGLREEFDRALDWFQAYLREERRTWEREQVRRSVAGGA